MVAFLKPKKNLKRQQVYIYILQVPFILLPYIYLLAPISVLTVFVVCLFLLSA